MENPKGISTKFLPKTEFIYRISVMKENWTKENCHMSIVAVFQQQDLLVNVTFALS